MTEQPVAYRANQRQLARNPVISLDKTRGTAQPLLIQFSSSTTPECEAIRHICCEKYDLRQASAILIAASVRFAGYLD